MKSEETNCLLRNASAPGKRRAPKCRPINARASHALHQLRLNAEELALELAVRLRVLGKSLEAACPGHGAGDKKKTAGALAYTNLRWQLDAFLHSVISRGFAGQHSLPAIREYLQETLPFELEGCIGGGPCRIEKVESVIGMLTECCFEEDALTEPLASVSR